MKQAITFFKSLFKKRETFSSVFSKAVSEGIWDTLHEMGYHYKGREETEDVFLMKKKK